MIAMFRMCCIMAVPSNRAGQNAGREANVKVQEAPQILA
jgi:hypothetical protein